MRYNTIEEIIKQLEKCNFTDEHGHPLENCVAFTNLKAMIPKKQNRTVILISGYKRSGKDYVADIFNKIFPDSSIKRFADPMKHILSTTLGLTLGELEHRKNRDMVERTYLQLFGNEAMKPWFGESVWADLLVSHIPESETVIIPDFRFLIEHETILKQFERVVTIRVIDKNLNPGAHASEHELDNFNFDYYIDNTEKSEDTMVQARGIAVLIKTLQRQES